VRNDLRWWQTAVIYHIYPLSFSDSSGDGIGDLAGITSRLDYLRSLGVDALWLSPIYASPMVDHGYDITDHKAINPMFGTLADFERLVEEIRRRDMRLILDFVPGHTSDQHVWFQESRASLDSPKRDWYVWRDPGPEGGPPSNWMGYFGPSWTYDASTGQYYLHQHASMPDLNWRSPAVLEAMLGVLAFWLDKGVDGFRVDLIAAIIKDDQFRDEPVSTAYLEHRNPYYSLEHIHTLDQAQTHDVVRELRRKLDAYGDRVMLGELDPIPGLMSYYGAALDECHLPLNLHLQNTPWQADAVRRVVDAYDSALPPGAWPNWNVSNHDQSRVASRVGVHQARVAQMLLMTLRGTPIWYYGDEIGMTDVQISSVRMRDAMGHLAHGGIFSRDPARTPMQWDAGPNAGFSAPPEETWLPIAPDYETVNVAVQSEDPRSQLNLFRQLVALRRETPELRVGTYRSIDFEPNGVFAYERRHLDARVVVALNFRDADQCLDLASLAPDGDVLLSTELDRSGVEPLSGLKVRPNEGVVLRPVS